jgi:hypothetical protein
VARGAALRQLKRDMAGSIQTVRMGNRGREGRYDVCNGDADGLCAVRQWRLHEPRPAVLITGLKRDTDLLAKVPLSAAREVLVCDISIRRNRPALDRLLAAGVPVRYFDHHATGGELPVAEHFEAHVEAGGRTCSCLLMDRRLGGCYRDWALVGAYGDNLGAVADALSAETGLDEDRRDRLRRLGELINYNAYGDSRRDVRMVPERMHALMLRYRHPLELLASEPVFERIERQREDDLARAQSQEPVCGVASGQVTILPDAPWSRRVIGSLANAQANASPARAHAVLKALAGGGYRVSVRAPLATPDGAAELCARFGGSGRAAAAGIDKLPAAQLDAFIEAFQAAWSPPEG